MFVWPFVLGVDPIKGTNLEVGQGYGGSGQRRHCHNMDAAHHEERRNYRKPNNSFADHGPHIFRRSCIPAPPLNLTGIGDNAKRLNGIDIASKRGTRSGLPQLGEGDHQLDLGATSVDKNGQLPLTMEHLNCHIA